MNFDITVIERFWQLLLSGVPVILGLSLASAFFGTLIGLATVFLRRMNKVFNLIVAAYIDLFRGTPVYVQMFFIYFGIPSLVRGLISTTGLRGFWYSPELRCLYVRNYACRY